MSDASLAIDQLRSSWRGLHDLDRAQAVKSIHQLGVRLVELASVLNCSQSLLTHLLHAGQAPLEDQALARHGVASTRALVRRAKAVGIRRTALLREEIAYEGERLDMVERQSISKSSGGNLPNAFRG